MTKAYGSTSDGIVKKDVEVTASKPAIYVTLDMYNDAGTGEFFIAIFDSTGSVISMNGNADPRGNGYNSGGHGAAHKEFRLPRTSGNFTIGEVVTVRFRSIPWDTTYPFYFYSILLELVD